MTNTPTAPKPAEHAHHVGLIPENPKRSPGRRLGRHVHFDARSRDHDVKALLAAKPQPLVSKLWARKAPILDQGQTGSCTGNGTAGAIGTAPNTKDGVRDDVVVNEHLAVDIYMKATKIDSIRGSFPPSDTGSTVLAAMKAAKAMGLIANYKWCFSSDDVLQALAHHGPVVVGFDWLAGFDKPDAKGIVQATGKLEGGHCFLLRGIEVDKKLVHADNSWGSEWGVKGSFSFSWADLNKLMKSDGEAAFVTRS